MQQNKIRVRIAPSPTGPLHLGTARAALFNFLFAKKNKGKFILRIEDTDLERSNEKFTQDIMENLKWLGIDWDEGPDTDGPFAPYRQSERLDIYEKYLKDLNKKRLIYPCFCTEEELEEERKMQLLKKTPPKYSGKCRTLTPDERLKKEKQGIKPTWRFAVTPKNLKINDLVRGVILFDSALLGDFIIAKDFRTPLYNFAVVIDDYTMQISHVIRGEDHISNTPKQILLQEALGFPIPQFAHLPLILNPDRTKMSKRHTLPGIFQTIAEYKNNGYLPQAMINFMALLGWNPKTEKEIFSKEELIKEFALDKVQRAGAIFDKEKLDYLNGFYIRKLPKKEFINLGLPYLEKAKLIDKKTDKKLAEKAILTEQMRIKNLAELPKLIDFFFRAPQFPPKMLVWKKASLKEIKNNLNKLNKFLEDLPEKDFSEKKLERATKKFIKENKLGVGETLWPLRVALSGRLASPSPFEIAGALGKKETQNRIKTAIQKIH